MKNIFLLFIVLSLFSCRDNTISREPSLQKDGTTVTGKDQSDRLEATLEIAGIADIKREHSYITSKTKTGNLDSASFKYNCNGEKEGKVTYFYEQEQLRLIRHVYNEYSHFSATDEYFITDGAPFFVLYNHLVWSFTGQNQTQDKITEKRFYILKNQAERCLEKKYTIISEEKDPTEPNAVSNKEVKCPSIEHIMKDFELLLKFRKQDGDMDCLEE